MSSKLEREAHLLGMAMIATGAKKFDPLAVYPGHRYLLDDGTQCVEAKATRSGITVGDQVDSRVTVFAKTQDGEEIAIPLSIKGTIDVISASIGFLRLANDGDESCLTLAEQKYLKNELRDVLEYWFDLGFELDRYAAPFKKSMELRRLQDLATLEVKATEKAASEMSSTIRKLSMAASMPDGIEKSVLLDELQPVIRKAFS